MAFIFMGNSHAQDLSEYRWENRMLLIVVDDLTLSNYTLQLKELQKDPKGLKERKLVVYTIAPDAYLKASGSSAEWQQSKKLYQKYKRPDTTFEILLIGLDGGVKARQTAIFATKDLFAVIDAMPMRRSEIKNKLK